MTREEIEERTAARRMQSILLGQDPRRIFLAKAPNTARGFCKYATDRIEQAARMLIELEFLEPFPLEKPAYLSEDDWRKHVAERCVEGVEQYDKHYGSTGRFDYKGKAVEGWDRWRDL